MGQYDSDAGVDAYLAAAEAIDGAQHVNHLKTLLPEGAMVLELGMGPGKDFDLLRQHFCATGTDRSIVFLERYQDRHPKADLLELDARTLATQRRFDGIYSNKVLQHLTAAELAASFARQAEILLPGGVALHTLWAGDLPAEEHDGLPALYWTEDALRALIPEGLTVVSLRPYAESSPDDSWQLVLRRPTDARRLQLRAGPRPI